MNETQYLTVQEASKKYNITRAHIYNRIKAGKMELYKIEGKSVVADSDVLAYINTFTRRKKPKKVTNKTTRRSPKTAPETVVRQEVRQPVYLNLNPLVALLGVIVGYFFAYFIFR